MIEPNPTQIRPVCGLIILKMPSGAPAAISVLSPAADGPVRLPTEVEIGEMLHGALEQRERVVLVDLIRQALAGPRVVAARSLPDLG